MGFFEVTAKCGHVGKDRYYPGLFYIKAENGKAAAACVRMFPRVKHDHKDAILAVVKVDYTAYQEGQAAHRANPYFNCHSEQEQRLFFAEFAEDIQSDTDASEYERCGSSDRKAKRNALLRYYRKMDKYRNYKTGA